jgi:hypothetical protein
MAVKKTAGKVIGQVQGLKIRQTNQTATLKGKTVTKSTQIGIFRGKTQLESGFKNRESAILRAGELNSKIVK